MPAGWRYASRPPRNVLTSQNDNARTSANLRETILAPDNVNAQRFGRIFSLWVDGGDMYAQPSVSVEAKGEVDVYGLLPQPRTRLFAG